MNEKTESLAGKIPPGGWIRKIVRDALAEDIGKADVTTEAIVNENSMAKAVIIAKQDICAAGMFMAHEVFRELDSKVSVSLLVEEGQTVGRGGRLMDIRGPTRALLTGERTVLNFMQRTCGIATRTNAMTGALGDSGVLLYDTRKTVPGLRSLDKYSVAAGGGCNHRMGLHDAILIKDNHIQAAGGVEQAIDLARGRQPDLKIQIEVTGIDQLKQVVALNVDAVLLDNMSPDQVRQALAHIRPGIITEVSGNITADNIRSYAIRGVTRISAGCLTHSVDAADLSMIIEKME